eukprot:GHVT01048308.1.p1 GENE.GHVT01048308.1~~GHVT01048308.1.p1  ORF type:complete len:358 (-),score=81.77 GHVT01048308.1:5405-6478(-)
MAKKNKKVAPKTNRLAKLDKEFDCPFCNHVKAVSVQMQRQRGFASLSCRTCGVQYGKDVARLDDAIDVYSAWLDACLDINKAGAAEAAGAEQQVGSASQGDAAAAPAAEGAASLSASSVGGESVSRDGGDQGEERQGYGDWDDKDADDAGGAVNSHVPSNRIDQEQRRERHQVDDHAGNAFRLQTNEQQGQSSKRRKRSRLDEDSHPQPQDTEDASDVPETEDGGVRRSSGRKRHRMAARRVDSSDSENEVAEGDGEDDDSPLRGPTQRTQRKQIPWEDTQAGETVLHDAEDEGVEQETQLHPEGRRQFHAGSRFNAQTQDLRLRHRAEAGEEEEEAGNYSHIKGETREEDLFGDED